VIGIAQTRRFVLSRPAATLASAVGCGGARERRTWALTAASSLTFVRILILGAEPTLRWIVSGGP
jgi:hypothetical protein